VPEAAAAAAAETVATAKEEVKTKVRSFVIFLLIKRCGLKLNWSLNSKWRTTRFFLKMHQIELFLLLQKSV